MTPGSTPDGFPGGRLAARGELRKALVERRLAMPMEQWQRHCEAICAHLHAGFRQLAAMPVAFCWPLRREPDLRPAIDRWRAEGHPGFAALLPVVIDEDSTLGFRAWSSTTAMFADRYGIPTPADGDFLRPQALLLPVNAFDAAGYRLGYGGGYFDRTLAGLAPRPLVIGVGFELARVDSIRPEAHDQPLDVMVTEAGIFRPVR
ncbi:5-formyltetrahydrofolate cyclo-ligase [Accumulibacter sp.]|uniref:5-formyltetrahydrofolate cyclo-ligase n=1 Tax=Accumulibacter sp. TaxID=2053492 RepID=UPI002638799F|nr:5-formyltetrahydrofolate cyclo-ligase [Accumulibacter sp.]